MQLDGGVGQGEEALTEPMWGRPSSALADRYRIERELGGGGMSRVFLARQLELGREVVITHRRPEQDLLTQEDHVRRDRLLRRARRARCRPSGIIAKGAATRPVQRVGLLVTPRLPAHLHAMTPMRLNVPRQSIVF